MSYPQHKEQTTPSSALPPIVYHIRSLRQWHGSHSLSQRELARRSGLSARQLRRYESARRLPSSLRVLILIALALDVSVEELLAPDLMRALRSEAQDFRARLDDGRDEHAGL